jgi:hypothetical protein
VSRAFRRTAQGVEARFADHEAELLDSLVGQVLELLVADPADGDPVLARLFPDGYRDDPAAAAELRSLVQDDLATAKRAALGTISAGLATRDGRGRLVLDDDAAEQWLTGLNDLRLTLGTRLDVTEDTYDEVGGGVRDELEEHLLEIYVWLGWVQETLVAAVSAGLR